MFTTFGKELDIGNGAALISATTLITYFATSLIQFPYPG